MKLNAHKSVVSETSQTKAALLPNVSTWRLWVSVSQSSHVTVMSPDPAEKRPGRPVLFPHKPELASSRKKPVTCGHGPHRGRRGSLLGSRVLAEPSVDPATRGTFRGLALAGTRGNGWWRQNVPKVLRHKEPLAAGWKRMTGWDRLTRTRVSKVRRSAEPKMREVTAMTRASGKGLRGARR